MAVCGLNVIVGFAGQISLGHAAFVGIGAYTAALLATKAGLSFWTGLPLVIGVSGLIGFFLGLPSIRVREDFLAITTIGINFIVEAVFRYIPFFGGALGIGASAHHAFRHEDEGDVILSALHRLPAADAPFLLAASEELGGESPAPQ